jgi:hypothetical protein
MSFSKDKMLEYTSLLFVTIVFGTASPPAALGVLALLERLVDAARL